MNIDLMNEGSEINVTDENKHDYIEYFIPEFRFKFLNLKKIHILVFPKTNCSFNKDYTERI